MHCDYYTWQSGAEIPPGKTPITILSGFLGTGKTTLLNSLLSRRDSSKTAVLVNDVGEINLDASLIKASTEKSDSPLKGMIELTSGCICCSSNSDLAAALFTLITEYEPEHIIIESSGVAEPQNTYQSLQISNSFDQKISDLLDIQSMITLVNPSYFVDTWESAQARKMRTPLLHSDPRQPLIELLVSQIEFADLILLTHTDQCSSETVEKAKGLIETVNDHAEIETAANGDIDSQTILQSRFDSQVTSKGVRWRSVLTEHEIDTEKAHFHTHRDYGITTWLYSARKPFKHFEFQKCLRQEFPELLRAKGFYWSDAKPEQMGFLSMTANILRMDFTGDWFAVLCEKGRKTLDQLPESLKKVWDEELGDRRQEIVFIGIDLDVECIKQKLDACLRDM